MLPTAGFFAKFDCPFFAHGYCQRPFCHFKHAKEDLLCLSPNRKRAGPENAPRPLKKGTHHKLYGASEKDPCFLELERINREIETVKCEVEKEQRRLSHYKTLQEDIFGSCSSKALKPHNGSEGKECIAKNVTSARTPVSAVVHAPGSKYVVDSSRPRTDLEYDPLSNYSSDLKPSSAVECRVQNCGQEETPSLKRMRENLGEDQRGGRPEEDDDDDGVLVIDIPPLEESRKRSRAPKLCSAVPTVLKESSGCIKSVSSLPELCDVPVFEAEISACNTACVKSEGQNCTDISPATDGNTSGKTNITDVFEDISKCLENLRSESKKNTHLPEFEPILGNSSFCASDSRRNFSPANDGTVPGDQTGMQLSSIETRSRLSNPPEQGNGVQPKMAKSLVLHEGNLPVPSPVTQQPKEQQGFEQGTPLDENSPVSHVPVVSCSPKVAAQLYFTGKTDHHSSSQAAVPIHQHEQRAVPHNIVYEPVPGPSISISRAISSTLALSASVLDETRIQEIDQTNKSNLSSEEEYLDMEFSDSDPMEECYRIFMEANQTEPADPVLSNVPVEAVDLDRSEMKKAIPAPGSKKRVAHVSKHEVTKTRPQVMVPFQRAVPLLVNPPKLQQLQQKAAVLTAAVKGGQAYVAATSGQKKQENLPSAPLPIPVQPTCLNILPVGAALQWGNVHLIIPDGTIALPLTPVPTPPTTPSAPPTVPVPLHTTLTHAKPITVKRKSKCRPEASTKVPHDVRQRYVNLFVEEFLRTSFTVQDAFEKALAEEKTIYDRSVNKLKYLSIAVNVLKRLKNQSTPSAKESVESNNPGSRGRVSFNPLVLQANDPGEVNLYTQLKEHILSEILLKENNYPFAHPEIPGKAIQQGSIRKGSSDSLKRICCRCGATYSVSPSGTHTRKEECNYHSGKVVQNKVPGGVETCYSCCEGAIGTPGCQLHVHDVVSMDGFVSSSPRPPTEIGSPGVFALNCDVCYTSQGLELLRVTLVNSNLQVIYDAFVKPDSEVIDYNTRFSGISEEDVSSASFSLRDVQSVLLSFISADTILIGHSLENDLCALKFIHHTAVDTAVVFPHRLGHPHKRQLCSLVADHLRRIIQESVGGHDSVEDATACMELMLWKVKEDSKVKRL
ncbi:RNA exonuclease 1 homolog isoform X2 [Brienomyrus brachyistius]|uniref:RNA exonuclease 1 homolog isoform X2 n=1 Tax=Brienomyrus brachyistius TaxID=42636 RepID=UPI0020B37151|nr:RNA exonuclease 1 homolog isoform X2 [Brienomyrus brachyistius]